MHKVQLPWLWWRSPEGIDFSPVFKMIYATPFSFTFQTFVCVPDTKHLQEYESFTGFYATIQCQQPITDLYRFIGRILIHIDGKETVTRALSAENVLLRGARLKNTPYVYGKVLVTSASYSCRIKLAAIRICIVTSYCSRWSTVGLFTRSDAVTVPVRSLTLCQWLTGRMGSRPLTGTVTGTVSECVNTPLRFSHT